MATLLPEGKQSFTNSAGAPLVGGKVYTYDAGTTNPRATYQDAAGTTPNTNPILLDARGEATIFWNGSYKVILKDASDSLIWSIDQVQDPQSYSNSLDVLLRADLATQNSAPKGAGQVGYGVAVPYSANSVGSSLNRVITPLNYSGNGLQSAIDFANSLGGAQVHIPHGTFVLTTGLTLYANVELVGRGTGTVLTFGDGVTAITATGTAGTRLAGAAVRNLRIQKTGGTTGHHLIATLCDRMVIDGVIFDGGLGANPCYAKFNGCRWLNMCYSHGINGGSILLDSDDGTTTGNWGEGNALIGCTVNGAKQGFDVIYQRGARLNACAGMNMNGTFGCGFVIEYENVDVVLTSCLGYGNVRDGFYVEGNVAFGCKDIQFIGCFGYSNGEAGLNLDANFKDVQILGGSYHSNTSAFGAGTGRGIMGAGSQYVTLNGVTIRDNVGDGVWYTDAFYLKLDTCSIRDNGGWGVNLQGTRSNVKFRGLDFTSNTSGSVNNWTYIGGNEWDGGPMESFTPTFYKSNEITTFTFTTVIFAFRRVNGMVEYEGYLDTPSSALDGYTFFSVPVVGSWPDNSGGGNASRPRGWAQMNTTGVKCIDGAFANDKLRISTTAAVDTNIKLNGRYEVV